VIYSEVVQSDLLIAQQAQAELEMFYLLSVEEGVMLLSQCQSSGTQKSKPSITKQGSKVLPFTGKRAG